MLRVCLLTYFEQAFAVRALSEALMRHGHSVRVVSPIDCAVQIAGVESQVRVGGEALAGYDAVFTRCVSYFHHGRVIPRALEAAVAQALQGQGAMALNDPAAKLLASDKVLSLMVLAKHGFRVPPTRFTANAAALLATQPDVPAVIKVAEGLQGAGVMRVDSDVSLRTVTEAFFAQGIPIVVQPDIARPDSQQLRVLVLGERVLTSYQAFPADGDFRANMHAGATPKPALISDEIATLAIDATHLLGLDFAGVDLISGADGSTILEVNPAPGFEVATNQRGVDVAEELVRFLEGRVRSRVRD